MNIDIFICMCLCVFVLHIKSFFAVQMSVLLVMDTRTGFL